MLPELRDHLKRTPTVTVCACILAIICLKLLIWRFPFLRNFILVPASLTALVWIDR